LYSRVWVGVQAGGHLDPCVCAYM